MNRAPRMMIRKGVTIACVLLLPGASVLSMAQTPQGFSGQGGYQQGFPQSWPQQTFPQQSSPQQTFPEQQAGVQLLSPDQLQNLVAPIALYPDPLLSEVLAASTYPLEVVEAGQWLQQNRNLQGQQLIEAAKQQNWDPSVQALVAFPDVVAQLNRDVHWTTDLGNAFLAQQADVMDAVQRLRAQARNNGRLESTPQQTVTTEQQDGQSAIAIQPADPQVIYVPQYNPVYVWGPPAYGAYPPLWYPPVGYGYGFGAGAFIGGLFSGLLGFGGWGWGLSWLSHGLFLNGLFFNHFGYHGYGGFAGTRAWEHSPVHRLGVPYPNHTVAGRYNAGGSRFNGGNINDGSRGGRFNGAGAGRYGDARPGNFNNRASSGRAEGASGYRGFGENRSGMQANRSFEQGSRTPQNSYRGGSSESYRGGSEAYRGGAGSQPYSAGGYRGGSPGSYQAPAQNYRGSSGYANSGVGSTYRNSGLARSYAPPSSHAAPRASQGFSGSHMSSPHNSAPRSSGGGGHSGGGGGHSSGGHSGGGRKH